MIIPPGFAQVNMLFDGTALPRGAQLVFGVQVSPADATTGPNFVADKVRSAFLASGSFGTILPSLVRLNQTRVKFGPNATGADGSAGPPIVGSLNESPDSPQVAVLIKKRTALGGRQGRGRMFLPFLTEAQTDSGGRMTAGAIDGYQVAAGGFLAGLVSRDIPMVLLHAAPEIVPTLVLALEVQSLVATQRRRLRKVGGRRSAVV